MACNDVRGRQVIDACSALDLAVPEHVAVVGVDNDEILCHFCTPPLSSVIPNAELVGFQAAESLAALIEGESLADRLIQVEPVGVETRQSTDAVAIEDRDVAFALRYIRENACQGITVDEVVKHSLVSRSTLERQVRRYLNRTPQEEIRNTQVTRAKELLLSSDFTVERIARLCGFEHAEYMHVVFKRIVGSTPGAFRKRGRGESRGSPR